MNKGRFYFVALLWVGASLLAAAGSRADDLERARRALERERFNEALNAARPYVSSPRRDEAREARLITAEAWIELGRFSDAIATLAPLLGDHPPGPADTPWVRLLARGLQGQGLLLEAADWWLTFATFGRDERREGERNLDRLLRGGLAQAELAYLLWKYPQNSLFCPVIDSYVEKEVDRGHRTEALAAWRAAGDLCGTGGRDDDLPGGLRDPEAQPTRRDFFTVGVLAPLNGPYARFGIAMANGADVARRLHNAQARFPLRLEIADTRGSPEGCLEALERMYAQGVRIFIGEVFSLHTLMAAANLRGRQAILVSPAATDSAIARIGAGTYTCTVGEYEQLAAMADYAADSLAVKNLAVLQPNSPEGRRTAQAFAQLAEERGIRIRFNQVYRRGTTDFSEIVTRSRGVMPDSVDGVFCPGGMRELTALCSQLAQEGLLGPYIGTAAMGDPVVAGVVEEFGLTALYPGETYVAAAAAPGSQGFEETYLRLFTEEPDEFAHRGWTAFGLIGHAVERGGYCAESLEELLESAAAPALRRGQGRALAVPAEVGVPGIHLRMGSDRRLAGRLGPRDANLPGATWRR